LRLAYSFQGAPDVVGAAYGAFGTSFGTAPPVQPLPADPSSVAPGAPSTSPADAYADHVDKESDQADG
jgi:hypothetical protein